MLTHWILDGHNPVPAGVLEWGVWFGPADRTVARSPVPGGELSTVFLGLTLGHDEHGAPLLFESLVFGGPRDGTCRRYPTWEEAERGHAEMLAECSALPAGEDEGC